MGEWVWVSGWGWVSVGEWVGVSECGWKSGWGIHLHTYCLSDTGNWICTPPHPCPFTIQTDIMTHCFIPLPLPNTTNSCWLYGYFSQPVSIKIKRFYCSEVHINRQQSSRQQNNKIHNTIVLKSSFIMLVLLTTLLGATSNTFEVPHTQPPTPLTLVKTGTDKSSYIFSVYSPSITAILESETTTSWFKVPVHSTHSNCLEMYRDYFKDFCDHFDKTIYYIQSLSIISPDILKYGLSDRQYPSHYQNISVLDILILWIYWHFSLIWGIS